MNPERREEIGSLTVNKDQKYGKWLNGHIFFVKFM